MSVRVKICGITNVEDAVAAARFGADFVGLNFYSGSPRCISEEQARAILHGMPKCITKRVAVFVNEPWDRIRQLMSRLAITRIQIHRDQFEPCPIRACSWIPAFSVRDESGVGSVVGELRKYGYFRPDSIPRESHDPTAVLMDAHMPGKYGGTGTLAPWHAIAALPKPDNGGLFNIILAGGLTPDNVAEAIRIVRPWAVDVASGVESSPGKKDHDKMRRFIENARGAAASSSAV